MRADRLSLNQATAWRSRTEDVLQACVSAGIKQVGLWRHKYVGGSAEVTHQALVDHGLTASSLCRAGFFSGTRSTEEAEMDNLRAIEEAKELGAPILVLVSGPLQGHDIGAAEVRVTKAIERLLPHADEAGVALALEPFHPMFLAERSVIVSLRQANRILDLLKHSRLTIALDTYHVWWDPDLSSEIARSRGRISTVHIADWLVPTPSVMAGRGLPGDGVIALPQLLSRIESTGFCGPIEIEVFNESVWSQPTSVIAREVVKRMRTFDRAVGPAGTLP